MRYIERNSFNLFRNHIASFLSRARQLVVQNQLRRANPLFIIDGTV